MPSPLQTVGHNTAALVLANKPEFHKEAYPESITNATNSDSPERRNSLFDKEMPTSGLEPLTQGL